MKQKSAHCFYSPIVNESRLFKEINSLLNLNLVSQVCVLGYWDVGLKQKELLDDKTHVIRLKTITKTHKFKNLLLKRFFSYISVIEINVKIILQLIKIKPNYITCHNLFLLPVCVIGKYLTGAKLIYAPHELETEKAGMNYFLKKIGVILEKYLIKYINSLVVVSDPIAFWYKNKYNLKNMFVLRNIPNKISINRSKITPNIFRNKFNISDDDIVFIYQGNLDKLRGCQELLECFKQIGNSFHIVFMGYGDLQELIEVESKKFTNIHFQSAVPTDEIINYTSSADIGINVIPFEVSLSYEYSLPNKFYEYLLSGLPIIVSSNLKYLSSEIIENKLGWVFDYKNSSFLDFLVSTDFKQFEKDNLENYSKNLSWEFEADILKEIYA